MYFLNPCFMFILSVSKYIKIKCQSKVPHQPTSQTTILTNQPTKQPANKPTNQTNLANLTNYSKLPVTDFQTKIYLPITNKHIDKRVCYP